MGRALANPTAQHSSIPSLQLRNFSGRFVSMLYNKERLIALMDKFDLIGIVAATPENVYYLSGHASWSQNGYRYGGSQVYVVYPRDPKQKPALLIPGGDVGYASLDAVWVEEKYIYGRPRNPPIADTSKTSP